MGDGQDRPEDVDESADLAGVVASLDGPEPGAVPEVTAETPESMDVETVDPEIAALQAELEAEGQEATPVAEQPASLAADDSVVDAAPEAEVVVAEPAVEPAGSTQAADVADEQAAVEDTKEIALPDDRAGIPVWPFLVYVGLWVVFAGLFVWQSLLVPAGTPLYELNLYGLSILVGLILTALGPLLAIGVWLACWLARPGARRGLFSRSLIIGAVSTLAGVAVWLIALGAVDMLRLGRLV
jgi:hypothetical protein